ncbi:MAG TPA: hypothetical protein VIW03_10235 [Anaeromyxobacter sp.]
MRAFRSTAACALVAASLALGCAGGEAASRSELDSVRAELRALRQDNAALARQVEALTIRLDAADARAGRAPAPVASAPVAAEVPPPTIVPPDLAVVKVSPSQPVARAAPPISTAVPIREPDPARLDALARRSGREIAAEADGELRSARRKSGVDRAHALEDFAARYPRHPGADNALVDAARAYAESGRDDAGCALARRAADDYPAGDAMSDALEVLASCEARRTGPDGERRLLERLVSEYPRTPAAERAERRLAAISGGAGGDSPAAGPARSGP